MRHERGNILFLILLAVILFAALSYAVTSSMKGGGSNASEEKTRLMAAQILENTAAIENQIMRATMMNNVPLHGFDFSSPDSHAASNATCVQPACEIFTTGGVASFPIPSWALHPGTSRDGKHRFVMGQIVNVGTSAQELIMLREGLNRAICAEINRAVGAADIDIDSLAQGWSWGGSTYYSGTLTDLPASTVMLGNTITAIAGKRSFCFAANDATRMYIFIHALVVR